MAVVWLPGLRTGGRLNPVDVAWRWTSACWSPSEVCFRLSPRYGIPNARDAHEWFIDMMREHEEFEVETDRAGEAPMPFCSVTVRSVVVRQGVCAG